ncbi:MAG: 2-phosphosulfolactate phosphatase [Clostridiaceae bacterium]
MNIDIIISAKYIKDYDFSNKIAIVIDTLRATSVIVTALNNGANRIIPVLEIEEALKLKEQLGDKVLLAGERKGLKIKDFDLSNSPLEYRGEVIKNKNIILTTSNGTRAIKGCASARKVYIASLLNGEAVSNLLIKENSDVVFVNAGTYDEFSMDDFITSGYIISRIMESSEAKLSDISKTAMYIYENNKDIKSYIKDAFHYKIMEELGFYDDLEFCIRKGQFNIVPIYKNGEIKIEG